MTFRPAALLALVLATPALADSVEDDPPPFTPEPTATLILDTSLYAQGRGVLRAGDDLSEVRLDRGELGARLGLGERAGAELRLETVRSAVEGGALGVDGNSVVARIRFAQITGGVDLGPVQLDGALGVVPDPWIRTVEDRYPLRALSRSATERMLGWSPADLSALVRATFGPARLIITVGNGEGLRFPERNSGKTTTAVLQVVALDTRAARLQVSAVGRDGSIGVASIRDRRAGGAFTLTSDHVSAGAEAVRAWGLGDRGDVEALAFGGWVEGALHPQLAVSARFATLGLDDGGRRSSFGGAVAAEPWPDAPGRVRLWLALDRITSSGDAMPLPGADPGDATVLLLIASADSPFTFD